MASAVSYCRRSKDLNEVGRNVEWQKRECEAMAKDLGLTIERTYTDNDISASRFATRKRTEWLQLLEAIEQGEVDTIVSVMHDRLVRMPRELEKLIDLAEAGKFWQIVTDERTYDLRTEDGKYAARLEVAAADREVGKLSNRLQRTLRRLRDEGRPTGGVFMVGFYGTRHGNDNDSTHEHYAPEVQRLREDAQRLLNGISASQIAREWSGQVDGITPVLRTKTKEQTPWQAGMISRIFNHPVYGGYRTFRGEIVDRPYEPIFDDKTYAELRELFGSRVRGKNRGAATRWTGFVICGGTMPDGSICGATMLASVDHTGRTNYKCNASAGRRACGHNYCRSDILETKAYAWIRHESNRKAFRSMLAGDSKARTVALERLGRIGERRKMIDDGLGNGQFRNMDAYNRALAAVDADETDALAQLRKAGSAGPVERWLGKGDALGAALASGKLTDDEHRALFLATKHRAVIAPPARPKAPFTADRINFVPDTAPETEGEAA